MFVTVKLNHIAKRGNVYYLRMAVPIDLRSQIGKSEIVIALKTSNVFEAQKKAEIPAQELKNMFAELRKSSAMPSTNKEQRYYKPVIPSLESNMELFQGEIAGNTNGGVSILSKLTTSGVEAPLFSEVMEECISSMPRSVAGREGLRSSGKLLMDWLGDKPISNYTRAMLILFIENCLKKIPPNRTKLEKWKALSLVDVKAPPAKRVPLVMAQETALTCNVPPPAEIKPLLFWKSLA